MGQPRSLSFESQTIALSIIDVFLVMYMKCGGGYSDPIFDLDSVSEVLEAFVVSSYATVVNRQYAEVLLGILQELPQRVETAGVMEPQNVLFII